MVASHHGAAHPACARLVNMSVPTCPGARRRSRRCATPPGDMFFILYFQEPGVADASWAATPPARCRMSPRAAATRCALDPTWFANDGRGFVERMPSPTACRVGCRAGSATTWRSSATRLTGGLSWYHHRSQLGDHRAGRSHGAGAVAVRGRRPGPGAAHVPARPAHGAPADHRGDVVVPAPAAGPTEALAVSAAPSAS
jgi:hypothetical protein